LKIAFYQYFFHQEECSQNRNYFLSGTKDHPKGSTLSKFVAFYLSHFYCVGVTQQLLTDFFKVPERALEENFVVLV